MKNEWQKVKFSDFATFKYGKMPNKKKITEAGKYPVYSGYRYVGYCDEYNTEANQLIIVARGVGGTGDVKITKEKCYLTNLSISANIDKNIALPEYIYYYYLQQNLRYLDSGSAQSQITISDLEKVVIPLPSLDEQEAISSYLKTIDSKIENNNQINNNLEELAQTYFKKLIPFKVGDKLPLGWQLGKTEDIIEIHDSKRIPLSSSVRDKMINKVYPYYGAASLMDYVDDYIFDGKYLLLGEDGTVIDSTGLPILQYVWGKFWVNNHAHILTGKNGFNVESLYLLFKQTSVKSIVTGAVQPKISQTNLKSIKVIIPPVSVLDELNTAIEPMFTHIRFNNDENKRLSQLRDLLLPKLMSGELDVPEIEL